MDTQTDRRTLILDAALRCFLERGYLATSIADIRRLSGASTGSIYHFFPNKGALARALLTQAVAGWSAAAKVGAEDAGAEATIRASVAGLVRWGLANPALVRFMDEIRTLSGSREEFADVKHMLAAGQAAAEERYRRWMAGGEVKPLPWPVAHSLMLGPAYNFIRLAAAGAQADSAPELLAEAAWAAVRAGGLK
jgi:AcrR family transcriptional regulator